MGKIIELKPGDIITCSTTEVALSNMEFMANNNIHCILHNYHNGVINRAIEVVEIGKAESSNVAGKNQGTKMWESVSPTPIRNKR